MAPHQLIYEGTYDRSEATGKTSYTARETEEKGGVRPTTLNPDVRRVVPATCGEPRLGYGAPVA